MKYMQKIQKYICCDAERLLQTLSAVRGSTRVGSRDREDRAWPDRNVKSGSGQTGWWPERRSKGAFERTNGKNASTWRAQPRLTEEGAATRCRPLCVICAFVRYRCRRQLDGVAIGTRRNTTRLERLQRAEGAKQRRA